VAYVKPQNWLRCFSSCNFPWGPWGFL